jgi:hypothetical protein
MELHETRKEKIVMAFLTNLKDFWYRIVKEKILKTFDCLDTVLYTSVVDPDPDRSRIQWGPCIHIRIRNPNPDPGGQNTTH